MPSACANRKTTARRRNCGNRDTPLVLVIILCYGLCHYGIPINETHHPMSNSPNTPSQSPKQDKNTGNRHQGKDIRAIISHNPVLTLTILWLGLLPNFLLYGFYVSFVCTLMMPVLAIGCDRPDRPDHAPSPRLVATVFWFNIMYLLVNALTQGLVFTAIMLYISFEASLAYARRRSERLIKQGEI